MDVICSRGRDLNQRKCFFFRRYSNRAQRWISCSLILSSSSVAAVWITWESADSRLRACPVSRHETFRTINSIGIISTSYPHWSCKACEKVIQETVYCLSSLPNPSLLSFWVRCMQTAGWMARIGSLPPCGDQRPRGCQKMPGCCRARMAKTSKMPDGSRLENIRAQSVIHTTWHAGWKDICGRIRRSANKSPTIWKLGSSAMEDLDSLWRTHSRRFCS